MRTNLTLESPRKTMALLLALATALGPTAAPAFAADAKQTKQAAKREVVPATPIQHIVVIFNENISFDHYFGTYPVATNPKGESKFKAVPALSMERTIPIPSICTWCDFRFSIGRTSTS